jgi:hypothetical protein
VYTPELKIKRFLDSLAYILLLGNTDGIETNYRRVMHAKREIPVTSCPSEIDNLLYGSGGNCAPYEEEEFAAFRDMLDRLDERASSYESKKVVKKKTPSLFYKKMKKGISGGTWCRVDTDGRFRIGDHQYIIDDQEIQYQPVNTEYGDYYAMDKILYADGKFYDMNYDEVKVLSER